MPHTNKDVVERTIKEERQYLDMLDTIMTKGEEMDDRTGHGTKSVFGCQMRYSLRDNILPVLTTKKVYIRAAYTELIWMIRGESNIKYLIDRNVKIWNEWPYENFKKQKESIYKQIGDSLYSYDGKENEIEIFDAEGKKYIVTSKEALELVSKYSPDTYRNQSENKNRLDTKINDNIETLDEFVEKMKKSSKTSKFVTIFGELWPVYWRQWRNFNDKGVDQLANAVEAIKNNPHSRRIIVDARNPEKIHTMALPPCPNMYQFYVNTNTNELSISLTQRSADFPLGVPFDMIGYTLLTHFIAKITWRKPGDFVYSINNAHIYLNQLEGVETQMTREPLGFPMIEIDDSIKTLDDLKELDWETNRGIKITWYESHPWIRFPIAV